MRMCDLQLCHVGMHELTIRSSAVDRVQSIPIQLTHARRRVPPPLCVQENDKTQVSQINRAPVRCQMRRKCRQVGRARKTPAENHLEYKFV